MPCNQLQEPPMAEQVKNNQSFSIQSAMKFFRDVRGELNRVTWPSAADTRRMTLMVFILVTIIALFLLAVDLLIGAGLSWLFDLNL
jgi:preprotein translocase subunit SecE